MPDLIEFSKNTVQYALIFIVIIFLASQLNEVGLQPDISDTFIRFYTSLAVYGGLSALAGIIFFGWFLRSDILPIPLAARLGVIAIFVFFIWIASSGVGQIIGVPTVQLNPLTLESNAEIYFATIIPGILEDFFYLAAIPMYISAFIFIILEFVVGIEIDAIIYSVTGIFSTFIAAIIFTNAHRVAYGEQNIAFGGAFIFGWSQSLVYYFTFLFVPLAHIVHNFIVISNRLLVVGVA